MSDTTDTQALADSISVHVKIMLDLNLEIAALEEKINDLRKDLSTVEIHKQQLVKDRREAQKLLTYCLDTNSDPTQARLSNSDEELLGAMKNRQMLVEANEREQDPRWLQKLGVRFK